MRPSSTKSSPSSGSVTFARASCTSSTVGMRTRIVGSVSHAAAGAACPVHRRPARRADVILKVGDAIGVLPTIALLAADSVLGSLLLRAQGRAVWRRFNETLAGGRMPHREVLDGVLEIFGGAFLITPG